MSRTLRSSALAAALLLSVPATRAFAQATDATDRATVVDSRELVTPAPRASAPVAAVVAPAPVAAHRTVATEDVRVAREDAAQRAGAAAAAASGRSKTLMVVGGAALVAGALIGDDVGTLFMVGGAIAGLYGLYLYMQ